MAVEKKIFYNGRVGLTVSTPRFCVPDIRFTHNTPTTQALQELTKRIARAKVDKIFLLEILLDIKNALIIIQPKIFTNKLEQYKRPKNLIKITDSVLRKKETDNEDENVRVNKHFAAGAPQGWPLGPLYWNLQSSEQRYNFY